MGAASERTPEAMLEAGLRKRKERDKSDGAIKASSKVNPLSQVWKPSQRAQTITIWVLLVATTFFSIAVVVEELQASWYRSPALNALNSQLHGAASLDSILSAQDDKLTTGPRNIILTWNVTKGVRSPDGLRSNVYLINDDFPGPVVEARPGDLIFLDLINSLENEDLEMHFGGEPLSAMRSSSGAKLAQSAMVAAQTQQQYGFQVPPQQMGTFLYRAKDQVQAASGLFGAFVVHEPSSTPDAESVPKVNESHDADQERVILISEWQSFTADRAASMSRPVLPPSILINGIGNRNCSHIETDLRISCVQKTGRSQPNMQFVAGQRYRLRLINAGTTSGVTVTIPGALMVIVELDGVKVVPKKATSIGVLKPGQTVDIMISWEGGGDDQFLVALEDDHGDGTITQSFPIRVSGFISSDLMPPPHRYRDVLRLKPFK